MFLIFDGKNSSFRLFNKMYYCVTVYLFPAAAILILEERESIFLSVLFEYIHVYVCVYRYIQLYIKTKFEGSINKPSFQINMV